MRERERDREGERERERERERGGRESVRTQERQRDGERKSVRERRRQREKVRQTPVFITVCIFIHLPFTSKKETYQAYRLVMLAIHTNKSQIMAHM